MFLLVYNEYENRIHTISNVKYFKKDGRKLASGKVYGPGYALEKEVTTWPSMISENVMDLIEIAKDMAKTRQYVNGKHPAVVKFLERDWHAFINEAQKAYPLRFEEIDPDDLKFPVAS